MSVRKRRVHDNNFKARVSLEAIREMKTIAEIASEYSIHPNQVSAWKKEALENLSSLFSGNKEEQVKIKELEEEKAVLHQRIGEQAMELDFLKKNCEKLGLLGKKK